MYNLSNIILRGFIVKEVSRQFSQKSYFTHKDKVHCTVLKNDGGNYSPVVKTSIHIDIKHGCYFLCCVYVYMCMCVYKFKKTLIFLLYSLLSLSTLLCIYHKLISSNKLYLIKITILLAENLSLVNITHQTESKTNIN